MLCLEDCLALCGLTEEEVLAIARHEGITQVAAAEMGNYLAQRPDGEVYIKTMILEDIADAAPDRALALKQVLRNFIAEHPRCEQRQRQEIRIPERRRT
jgi:hypothetical protein